MTGRLVTPLPPTREAGGSTQCLDGSCRPTVTSFPSCWRLTLAFVMFPHGAQKALGWFGGSGFKGTVAFFRKSGIPSPSPVLAIMAELLGPLGLAVGLS